MNNDIDYTERSPRRRFENYTLQRFSANSGDSSRPNGQAIGKVFKIR